MMTININFMHFIRGMKHYVESVSSMIYIGVNKYKDENNIV